MSKIYTAAEARAFMESGGRIIREHDTPGEAYAHMVGNTVVFIGPWMNVANAFEKVRKERILVAPLHFNDWVAWPRGEDLHHLHKFADIVASGGETANGDPVEKRQTAQKTYTGVEARDLIASGCPMCIVNLSLNGRVAIKRDSDTYVWGYPVATQSYFNQYVSLNLDRQSWPLDYYNWEADGGEWVMWPGQHSDLFDGTDPLPRTANVPIEKKPAPSFRRKPSQEI